MKVLPYVNGKEIQRDAEDLDFIKLDVINDVVRTLEPLETNPDARVEVDLSQPADPNFRLVNCSSAFERKFYDILRRKKVTY